MEKVGFVDPKCCGSSTNQQTNLFTESGEMSFCRASRGVSGTSFMALSMMHSTAIKWNRQHTNKDSSNHNISVRRLGEWNTWNALACPLITLNISVWQVEQIKHRQRFIEPQHFSSMTRWVEHTLNSFANPLITFVKPQHFSLMSETDNTLIKIRQTTTFQFDDLVTGTYEMLWSAHWSRSTLSGTDNTRIKIRRTATFQFDD